MFDHLVDLTEPICQNLDSALASMTIFDTSGIEAWVSRVQLHKCHIIMWLLLSTGSNCLIPPPNREPIPAAIINNVVFIFTLSPFHNHFFINIFEKFHIEILICVNFIYFLNNTFIHSTIKFSCKHQIRFSQII